VEDQVPTWNYVAVHLRGSLRLLPDTELAGILERLSGAMEARLAPKPIWKMDKVSPDALSKMMRQIVPIAMDIDDIDGTWKLAQNKLDAARLDASEALEQTGFGLCYQKIADLMRNPPS
jgi:transcriptional regulator